MCRHPVKGRTCKNPGEPFCWLHKPKEIFPIETTLEVKQSDKNKILSKLKRGPALRDVEGFVYVFYLATDDSDVFYKIGRTTRTVEERLKEWPNSRFKWCKLVKHNEMTESFIHRVLNKHRVYRYKQEDGSYLTVQRDTGETIEGKGCKEGIKKEVEWFMAPWTTIEPVLSSVIKLTSSI